MYNCQISSLRVIECRDNYVWLTFCQARPNTM
jgi:hypothetical protein